jgi:carbon-monoxide dehydrogenase small subunit
VGLGSIFPLPAQAIPRAGCADVEGFEDDAVMLALREAFSAQHVLQCGYCTPDILVVARDVVLRLPDADEARVREEMASNLCRCTGYRDIVRAILVVSAARGAA